MDNVIGTCSLCGGAVVVPSVWYGIHPPTPTCRSCGATKVNPHGPVIDMEPTNKPMKLPSVDESFADWIEERFLKNR